MAKYNQNLSGTDITDEVIYRTGSTSSRLNHDTILYDSSTTVIELWTAAGGTGTQLTLTTDFTLGDEDTDLTTAVGGGTKNVYTTLAIVNGTYQNTNIYVTYKTIGDYVEVADVNIPASIGDFDISASDETYSALLVPDRFRVSWYDGDGSNTFSFTDTTGITLNGIALSEYVGDGTGHLDIDTRGGAAWETLNDGMWDSDAGNFSYIFSKYIDGVYSPTVEIQGDNFGEANVYNAISPHLATIGEYLKCSGRLGDAGSAAPSKFQRTASDTITEYYVDNSGNRATLTYKADGSGTATDTLDFELVLTGGNTRWTTSYPRKS